MSHFPAIMPQGALTASAYTVFVSAAVTPAVGNYSLGTTVPTMGSFIPTDLFVYVPSGPTSSVASNVRFNFAVGFTSPNYNEFLVALVTSPPTQFGGDGSSPEQANNFVRYKFRQYPLRAGSNSGTGYAAGTPRNAAVELFARITALAGTISDAEQVQFILGGIYTGVQ